MFKPLVYRIGVCALFVFATLSSAQSPTSCDALSDFKLDDGAVTKVSLAPADADTPASCRVAATLRPTTDSEIKIEVWMPVAGWNGKFLAIGNGGWSGVIATSGLVTAIKRGYAGASTDTGHSGGSGSFALGHPEKLVDFGWRAVHEMTVKAKVIIAAYYGNAPRLSYWSGCSSGGKQGLKEIQKFPNDYDGVLAGAPANYWTHLSANAIAVAQATLKDPASYLSKEKYATLHKAALEKCDARDGVIENPSACKFDPKVTLCAGAEKSDCLTAPQVEAARKIYNGDTVYPGMAPGSEMGWGALAGGPKPLSISEDYFKYVVFKDANWDFKTLNFDSDITLADKLDASGGNLNAIDPDLSKFFAHGGKLVMYHGWNDQLISPQNSINYFTSLKSKDNARLFMAPGMMHCGGGDGPNNVSEMLPALERWVEKGQAPESVVASRPGRTRPLCAYPKIAQYKGSGSTDDALSFVCAAQPEVKR